MFVESNRKEVTASNTGQMPKQSCVHTHTNQLHLIDLLCKVWHDVLYGRKSAFTLAEGATHVTQSSTPRRAAFTLAEVLITLGIIGVVAAMTLPALMQNYQKAQTVSQLKRSYAIMQMAVSAMMAEYEGLEVSSMPFVHQKFDHKNYFDQGMFAEEISKHLNFVERGHRADESNLYMCAPNDNPKPYKMLGGKNFNFWAGVTYWWKLNDGSCFAISSNGWTWDDTNGKVAFWIDINGSDKNPNQLGKDVFAFNLLRNGKVVPYYTNAVYDSACIKGRRGLLCSEKIINDGWQIKSDYPW